MIAAPDRTPLTREFFDRPVLEVAPDLLGRILVRTTPDGPIELRLTEVEAYDGPDDPGSHAYRGRTARNGVMFGPPGHVYVYFTYGMWFCMNLVCGPVGRPSGVLLRAGEVVEGAELARKRRLSARNDKELAKGPARLATALDVDRSLDGTDACAPEGGPLTLLEGTPAAPDQVRNGPRTGVSGDGGVHPWRFWIANDPTVSPYRAHTPRRRST
ncbi:DNA-3-methyladenine glycosylase [Streptomyces sp. NPDC003483]